MAGKSEHYTSGGKMIRKAALPTRNELKASDQAGPTRKRAPSIANNENVRVMVRVRPFSVSEVSAVQDEGYMQSVIDVPRSDQVIFRDHLNDYQVRQGFNFDRAFWSCTQQQSEAGFSSQLDVYEATGQPAVETAWDGINSCIFAYGQTGSGKTHTMMGDPSQIATEDGCNADLLGVIPRLCQDLFVQVEEKLASSLNAGIQKKVEIEVRFMEIYNEKVRDLLVNAHVPDSECFKETGVKGPGAVDHEDLRIREHPVTGPYVHGVTVYKPKSYDQIIELINQGNQERSVGATKLNDRSSRSHAMFRVTLTQTTIMSQERVGIGGPKTISSERRSNINLVDLAGSENVKRSGAAGTTLIEAQKINLSLTTLRRVIDALIERKSANIVPYRDSTLTWLLRQDLGGNAKTFMLATVSPHFSNAHESQRTLEYAMRAKSIVNSITVNEDDTAKMLADLEKRIMETEKAMQSARGTASNEELEAMQVDLCDTQKAKEQIAFKFEQAAQEAETFKAELKTIREKNVARAFKSAVVLNMTRTRLKEAQSTIETKETEVQNVIDQLKVTEAQDRQLIEDMLREKEEMKARSEAMKTEEDILRKQLSQEQEALAKKKLAIRDLESRGQSQNLQNLELNDRIGELTDKMSSLLRDHEEEQNKVKRHHDHELSEILKESEEMMKNHQTEIEKLHTELNNAKEQARKHLRAQEYDSEYKMRLLYGDIEAIREELMVERSSHGATKALLSDERAKLASEEAAHNATKEAFADKVHELEADIHMLKEHARECEEEVTTKVQEKEKLRQYFADVEDREAKYERTHEEVCKLLEEIQASEGIPEAWGIDEVKQMVAAFRAYKKSYSSNKPNRATLRQMLRADPERKGAGRMRELLDGGVSTTYPSVHVIMDGIKCPALPHRSKSPAASKFDPDLHGPTDADRIPYMSDSPKPGSPGPPAQSSPHAKVRVVPIAVERTLSRARSGTPNGKSALSSSLRLSFSPRASVGGASTHRTYSSPLGGAEASPSPRAKGKAKKTKKQQPINRRFEATY